MLFDLKAKQDLKSAKANRAKVLRRMKKVWAPSCSQNSGRAEHWHMSRRAWPCSRILQVGSKGSLDKKSVELTCDLFRPSPIRNGGLCAVRSKIQPLRMPLANCRDCRVQNACILGRLGSVDLRSSSPRAACERGLDFSSGKGCRWMQQKHRKMQNKYAV